MITQSYEYQIPLFETNYNTTYHHPHPWKHKKKNNLPVRDTIKIISKERFNKHDRYSEEKKPPTKEEAALGEGAKGTEFPRVAQGPEEQEPQPLSKQQSDLKHPQY